MLTLKQHAHIIPACALLAQAQRLMCKDAHHNTVCGNKISETTTL